MSALFGGLIPSDSSQQTQQTQTFRVLDFRYGNGYEQVLPDGANAYVDTWQLTWDNIAQAQYLLLLAWLQANPPWVTWNGDGVILPSANTYRMTNDGWQVLPMSGSVYGVSFNIQQVF
jgi:phage-related protein